MESVTILKIPNFNIHILFDIIDLNDIIKRKYTLKRINHNYIINSSGSEYFEMAELSV